MTRAPKCAARTAAVALFSAVWLLSVSVAAARDIYVSNLQGDDQLSGLEPKVNGADGPVRTINRGLSLAGPSDRVIVANTGQPYREAIAISGPRLVGAKQRPFRLTSDGAVLDGTVTAELGAWRHLEGDLFAFRPRRLTYQQLFKDGKPLPRVNLITVADRRALAPLHWALARDAVLLRVEKAKLPRDYNLRHAGLQTGITLYNTRHVVVEGFVVQGFQLDGVNAHELATNCTLRNLECRANGRSGLSIGGASRVAVEQSQFYDNGRVQVRTERGARAALVACEVDPKHSIDFENRGRELTIDGKEQPRLLR